MIRTLVSIALLALLGACGTPGPDTRSQAQQTLDGFRTAFLGANLLIAGYALRPPCGDGAPPVCLDLNLLAQLTTGANAVDKALAVAQAGISAPDSATTLERVNAALIALTRMLVEARLK